jgi:hypothetical protein
MAGVVLVALTIQDIICQVLPLEAGLAAAEMAPALTYSLVLLVAAKMELLTRAVVAVVGITLAAALHKVAQADLELLLSGINTA